MARRRRRRRSSAKGRCKIVRVPRQGMRKICWGRNGKIKSNTAAGGGRRRRRSRRRRSRR